MARSRWPPQGSRGKLEAGAACSSTAPGKPHKLRQMAPGPGRQTDLKRGDGTSRQPARRERPGLTTTISEATFGNCINAPCRRPARIQQPAG